MLKVVKPGESFTLKVKIPDTTAADENDFALELAVRNEIMHVAPENVSFVVANVGYVGITFSISSVGENNTVRVRLLRRKEASSEWYVPVASTLIYLDETAAGGTWEI